MKKLKAIGSLLFFLGVLWGFQNTEIRAAVFETIHVMYPCEAEARPWANSGPSKVGDSFYGVGPVGNTFKIHLYRAFSWRGKERHIAYADDAITDGKTIYYQNKAGIYKYGIRSKKRSRILTAKKTPGEIVGLYGKKLYFVKRIWNITGYGRQSLYCMDLRYPNKKAKKVLSLPFESVSETGMYGKYIYGIRGNDLYVVDITTKKRRKLSGIADRMFQHKGELYFLEYKSIYQNGWYYNWKLKRYNFRTKKTKVLVPSYISGYIGNFGANEKGVFAEPYGIIYRW